MKRIKRKKLPDFLKNSSILDDLQDDEGYVIIPERYRKDTTVNSITDYINLLDTVTYFLVKIPKEIKKFEKDPKNENEILLSLLNKSGTAFYDKKLEDFKFLISNRNTCAINLYTISGTDPQKDSVITVFLTKKHKVNKKIKKVILEIYEELLEHGDEENKKFYKEIVKKIKTQKDFNLEKLPYNPIFPGADHVGKNLSYAFNKKEGLYKAFEEPYGFLVALDYVTSYDRHYYIEITEKINNKIELVVHEH